MNERSTVKHRFRRAAVPADNMCLFWSILILLKLRLLAILDGFLSGNEEEAIRRDVLLKVLMSGPANKPFFELNSMRMFNEKIRKRVAAYIRADANLQSMAVNCTDEPCSPEAYCDLIEKGTLWAGDLEISILSNSLNILICIIFLEQERGQPVVYTSFCGEQNPNATQCVFILYDRAKGHYSPLYLVNLEGANEHETVFDRNDGRIVELLREFIKEDLRYAGQVKLDGIPYVNVDQLVSATSTSRKRKERSIDDIVSPIDEDKPVLEEAPAEYYDPNKRLKMSIASTTTFPDHLGESAVTEQRIQGEQLATDTHQPTRNLPIESPQANQEETLDMESKIAGESDDNGMSKTN